MAKNKKSDEAPAYERKAAGEETPLGSQTADGELITQETIDSVAQARRNAHQQ